MGISRFWAATSVATVLVGVSSSPAPTRCGRRARYAHTLRGHPGVAAGCLHGGAGQGVERRGDVVGFADSQHRKSPVVVTNLNDINNQGDIVGNVCGLTGKDYSKLRSIHPVGWRCPFQR